MKGSTTSTLPAMLKIGARSAESDMTEKMNQMNIPAPNAVAFLLETTDTSRAIPSIAAFKTHDAKTTKEMVRTLNGYFGGRIGVAYAEPFFTHEALGFSGLDQLV